MLKTAIQDTIKVYRRNVYEVNIDGMSHEFLVIFNISDKEFVGYFLNDSRVNSDDYYIEEINRYITLTEMLEVRKYQVKKVLFNKNKYMSVSEKQYKNILRLGKKSYITSLDKNTNPNNIEDVNYGRWCLDKYKMIFSETNDIKYKERMIVWINLGVNVGSELRKIRPAILWRATKDKKMWTIIPLTSQKYNDGKYFHVDLEYNSTAKIESISNLSYKRILGPKYEKKKIC